MESDSTSYYIHKHMELAEQLRQINEDLGVSFEESLRAAEEMIEQEEGPAYREMQMEIMSMDARRNGRKKKGKKSKSKSKSGNVEAKKDPSSSASVTAGKRSKKKNTKKRKSAKSTTKGVERDESDADTNGEVVLESPREPVRRRRMLEKSVTSPIITRSTTLSSLHSSSTRQPHPPPLLRAHTQKMLSPRKFSGVHSLRLNAGSITERFTSPPATPRREGSLPYLNTVFTSSGLGPLLAEKFKPEGPRFSFGPSTGPKKTRKKHSSQVQMSLKRDGKVTSRASWLFGSGVDSPGPLRYTPRTDRPSTSSYSFTKGERKVCGDVAEFVGLKKDIPGVGILLPRFDATIHHSPVPVFSSSPRIGCFNADDIVPKKF
eukprot:TRINITY_DN469_c0_g1_i1.p1 TRINITY_DN469_c0_g1~~TRINITY_DN469_c0_g1_i1.p1  ORF type:complete len:375 (-),score=89.38 TRINITY_DN469_c0_g1_i1:273-1397(-)